MTSSTIGRPRVLLVLGVAVALIVAVLASIVVPRLFLEWKRNHERQELAMSFARSSPMSSAGWYISSSEKVYTASLKAVPVNASTGLRFRLPTQTERKMGPDGVVGNYQIVGWKPYRAWLLSMDSDGSSPESGGVQVRGALPEGFEFRLITPKSLRLLEDIHRLEPIDELRIEAHAPYVLELPSIRQDLDKLREALPGVTISEKGIRSGDE